MTTLWLDRAIFNKTATTQNQLPLANPPDPRLAREDQLVWLHHKLSLGWPIEYISRKQLLRRQRVPDADTLVVGNIEFVHAAFTAMKIERPEIDYYPRCLKPWFRRNMTLRTKEDACAYVWMSDIPVFVKPADRLKSFTGFVVDPINATTLEQTNYPKRGRVWCSDPVAFTTEWRVYVVNNAVRAIGWYGGDDTAKPPMDKIEEMVSAMSASYHRAPGGWRWKNYVVDVGLVNGELTLVEAGLGYSMGAYEIKASDYYELVSGFWKEVTSR